MSTDVTSLRIDKWLWVARFFKTRSLAQDAVEGGKVKLNGQTVKPAKELKAGDQLEISSAEQRWQVQVLGINTQRRPAAEARLLYEESVESQERRAREQELRKLSPTPGADLQGRPSKRDGRLIRRMGGRG